MVDTEVTFQQNAQLLADMGHRVSHGYVLAAPRPIDRIDRHSTGAVTLRCQRDDSSDALLSGSRALRMFVQVKDDPRSSAAFTRGHVLPDRVLEDGAEQADLVLNRFTVPDFPSGCLSFHLAEPTFDLGLGDLFDESTDSSLIRGFQHVSVVRICDWAALRYHSLG